MDGEPLISWGHVGADLLEFVGAFLAIGAVGFLALVLPAVRRRGVELGPLEPGMVRTAAVLGLLGALVGAWHLSGALSGQAARRHVTVPALLASQPAMAFWAVCVGLVLVGMILLLLRVRAGLWLATLATFAAPLRSLLAGRPLGLLKPFHVLAGGLWLGTLFVLVVAGLGAVLASRTPAERRGPLTAAMVEAFSPMALGAGMVLAGLGVWMSARELQPLSLLWTSPYGLALCAKVAVAGLVYGVGAWNAFRLKPHLGSEPAARGLQRSATVELVLATLVLVATAIFVGMPEPGGR